MSLVSRLRLLRIGTEGRGVWELPVDNISPPVADVYVRDTVIDTGLSIPPTVEVLDPFSNAQVVHWWQCRDIKLDSPPYQTAAAGDVGFVFFEDDHGFNPQGLLSEGYIRGQVARVYVQVHVKGPMPATSVVTTVFCADASLMLPQLPNNFWVGFPNNTLAGNSPWQRVGNPIQIGRLEPGRPRVISFDWLVPTTTSPHSCLLIVVTSAEDPILPGELDAARLVLGSNNCGLRNVAPAVSQGQEVILLKAWYLSKNPYVIGSRGDRGVIGGAILSSRLAKDAERQRLGWRRTQHDERAALKRAVGKARVADFDDERVFDLRSYSGGLKVLDHTDRDYDEIAIVWSSRSTPGVVSLIQWDDKGRVTGGFTFDSRRVRDKTPDAHGEISRAGS